MTIKICTKCTIEQDRNQFYKKGSVYKICTHERSKELRIENLEWRRQRDAIYRIENIVRIQEYDKSEKRKKLNRENYHKHGEKRRAHQRENYCKNKEKRIIYRKLYSQKLEAKIKNRIRIMARRRGMRFLSKEQILHIIRCKAQPCIYCGGPGGTIDHVVCLDKGGTWDIWNLVSACVSCNSSKGTKWLEEWRSDA